MLVRGVLFDDLGALLGGCFYGGGRFGDDLDFGNGNDDGFGYGFDDFLVSRPPRLGAARFQDRERSEPIRDATRKGLENGDSGSGTREVRV
jgi:hypothetical protein